MILTTTAALALFLCQDPPSATQTQPGPVKPVHQDVIELVGGEQIVGTITMQRGNYIEVKLDEGTVIGFERTRVRAIHKGTVAAVAKKKAILGPRDDWYLLHDARGMSAGYMHALVKVDRKGAVEVSEEWFFTTKKGRIQVTVLEAMDEMARPKRSFYHERVLSDSDRLLSERLVNAEVAGRHLVVQRRSLKGRERQKYRFADSARFPLSYREQLRQARDTQIVAANQELFDARSGQFRIWNASSLPRRKVEIGGQQKQVRELSLDDGTGANTEWIDAQHHVVRREVNGASLVAVRVDKERALRAIVSRGATGFDPAIVTSDGGDMALWLPNPIWRATGKEKGTIRIEAPLYDGSAILMIMEQIPANVQLDSAADLLERWLKLTIGKHVEVQKREGMQVQREAAVRLKVAWSADRLGESVPWRGVCHVFRLRGRYAALFCSSPLETSGELYRDFNRILASVQLDPQDIEPVPQGPIARRR